MDSEESCGPPSAYISADQIVAWNIRFWRLEAKLTQGELGERVGLSGKNISDVERSAATDRRTFDAGTLVMYATALDIPVALLLFPPTDDGEQVRYIVKGDDGSEVSMADLARLLLPPADGNPAESQWLVRVGKMRDKYLLPDHGLDMSDLLEAQATMEDNRAMRKRLAGYRDALAALLVDIDQMSRALYDESQDLG